MDRDDLMRCIDAESGGAVRISFGLVSNFSDAHAFVTFARGFRLNRVACYPECFWVFGSRLDDPSRQPPPGGAPSSCTRPPGDACRCLRVVVGRLSPIDSNTGRVLRVRYRDRWRARALPEGARVPAASRRSFGSGRARAPRNHDQRASLCTRDIQLDVEPRPIGSVDRDQSSALRPACHHRRRCGRPDP